jgi:hypothetical protein
MSIQSIALPDDIIHILYKYALSINRYFLLYYSEYIPVNLHSSEHANVIDYFYNRYVEYQNLIEHTISIYSIKDLKSIIEHLKKANHIQIHAFLQVLSHSPLPKSKCKNLSTLRSEYLNWMTHRITKLGINTQYMLLFYTDVELLENVDKIQSFLAKYGHKYFRIFDLCEKFKSKLEESWIRTTKYLLYSQNIANNRLFAHIGNSMCKNSKLAERILDSSCDEIRYLLLAFTPSLFYYKSYYKLDKVCTLFNAVNAKNYNTSILLTNIFHSIELLFMSFTENDVLCYLHANPVNIIYINSIRSRLKFKFDINTYIELFDNNTINITQTECKELLTLYNYHIIICCLWVHKFNNLNEIPIEYRKDDVTLLYMLKNYRNLSKVALVQVNTSNGYLYIYHDTYSDKYYNCRHCTKYTCNCSKRCTDISCYTCNRICNLLELYYIFNQGICPLICLYASARTTDYCKPFFDPAVTDILDDLLKMDTRISLSLFRTLLKISHKFIMYIIALDLKDDVSNMYRIIRNDRYLNILYFISLNIAHIRIIEYVNLCMPVNVFEYFKNNYVNKYNTQNMNAHQRSITHYSIRNNQEYYIEDVNRKAFNKHKSIVVNSKLLHPHVLEYLHSKAAKELLFALESNFGAKIELF